MDDERKAGSDLKAPEEQEAGDPTVALRRSLEAIDAKLQRPDGWEGLSAWLDDVESALKAVDLDELEKTRSDIRDVIDELLEINAHVQNVLRLKQLFS